MKRSILVGLLDRELGDFPEGVDVALGEDEQAVSAAGAMSRMATKPSAACTWSPSATSRQKRQSGSGGNGEDSLVAHADRPCPHHLADGAVDEPGRVVVRVATARLVEEDDVPRCRRGAAAAPARQSPASASVRSLRSFFTGRRDRIVGGGARAGTRRIGEDVHLRHARGATAVIVFTNACSSSVGKPTMTSVVRLKSSRPPIRLRNWPIV